MEKWCLNDVFLMKITWEYSENLLIIQRCTDCHSLKIIQNMHLLQTYSRSILLLFFFGCFQFFGKSIAKNLLFTEHCKGNEA